MLRYIFKNTANQEGFRIFGGFGLTIPSNSELTSDPYFLNENSIKEHRHFSLSDGTYNSNFETQIFYKRNRNPMFIGGFILYENPLHENKYRFLPSSRLIVRLSWKFVKNYNIPLNIHQILLKKYKTKIDELWWCWVRE